MLIGQGEEDLDKHFPINLGFESTSTHFLPSSKWLDSWAASVFNWDYTFSPFPRPFLHPWNGTNSTDLNIHVCPVSFAWHEG